MRNRFDCIDVFDKIANETHMDLKATCVCMEEQIEALPNSRERNLALTKLEEVFMWLGKAIRNDQLDRLQK